MAICVLGAQWGDEGKGKITDLLTAKFNIEVVARMQGGHNAGHTVWINGQKYVLHLIPSGVLAGATGVLGAGMVICPEAFLSELQILTDQGVDLSGRIFISSAAHLITPWAKYIDGDREDRATAGQKIGTTRRGIGPTYEARAGRYGIRVDRILDPVQLGKAIMHYYETVKPLLPTSTHATMRDDFERFVAQAQQLIPYVQDTRQFLWDFIDTKGSSKILVEGAQGANLSLCQGNYPFVTSSDCTSGAITEGLGLPHSVITRTVGVFKAYATRVGEGPLRTEIFGEDAEVIRKKGCEYGASTGRPRRVAWLDLHNLRSAVRLNGIDQLIMTKADVLDGFDSIHMAANDGEVAEYTTMEGWKGAAGLRDWSELPYKLHAYIHRVQSFCGVPVIGISTGCERDDFCWRED